MDLRDRVVLITGAARRVGRAIALRLADAGGRIAAHYRTSAGDAEATVRECRGRGARAAAFCADLADASACRRLVREVLAQFGRLDVLVHNASVFEPTPIERFDLDAWEQHLRVNLTAPMVLTAEAREQLIAHQGVVVTLCDAATVRPWPEHLAYIVSKAGLECLTRALARALAPQVRVVGVAPGVVAWPEDYDDPTRRRLTAKIPLKRGGTPEDVASAVHYLLAEGDFVTGTILTLDGGRYLR